MLNVSEIQPLPEQMLATARSNALEWMKIGVATSQDLRNAVSYLERFTGKSRRAKP